MFALPPCPRLPSPPPFPPRQPSHPNTIKQAGPAAPSIPSGCPLQPDHPNAIKQAGPAVPTGRSRLLVVSSGPGGGLSLNRTGHWSFERPVRIAAGGVRTGRSNCGIVRPVRIAVRGSGSNGPFDPLNRVRWRYEGSSGPFDPPPAPATEPHKHNQTNTVIKTVPISSTAFNSMLPVSKYTKR